MMFGSCRLEIGLERTGSVKRASYREELHDRGGKRSPFRRHVLIRGSMRGLGGLQEGGIESENAEWYGAFIKVLFQ